MCSEADSQLNVSTVFELKSLDSLHETQEFGTEAKYVQSPAECMSYYLVASQAVRVQGLFDTNHLYHLEWE